MVNNFQRLSVLVAALLPVGLAAPVQSEERDAESFGVVGASAKDSYIITLKDDLEARDVESHLDWLNEVQARALNKRDFPGARTTTSVVNLSLGGGFSTAFNNAINAASAQGVVSVIAAGNENQNVANVSPASAVSAIAVGAVDSAWAIASYSNWGAGVTIFAPGSNVLSAWIGSNTATRSISGTSMASPHVAGLVVYLQRLEGRAQCLSLVSPDVPH
ncbi:hypothetical protein BN1708_009904 [Verticillium longisporum]|uniref:Peptidase S8/S53 domain-containing protein n=1 Tax=Verticillium longisporum TaxID=100787 RepID=A0A0G4KLX7_VERLO|nr:hypothetical protein BN1708_009904 [Verticillium longisporum]